MRRSGVRFTRVACACIALLLAAHAGAGPAAVHDDDDSNDERAEYIRANYAKFEHRIPMRDGATLFTAVYVPNDRSETYPIMLVRTPYDVGPYGADRYAERLGPSEQYERDGYIFVFQDVRGRYMSEGEFVNMRPQLTTRGPRDTDESTDTWDTIDWLIHNVEGHNGNVGQWGISYPGFYTSAGMIDSHPALKAASPQAPIADWFWDDMHRHGAFVLPLSFTFFSSFGRAREELTTSRPERFDFDTPDGYRFFLELGPLSNVNELHFKDEVRFWTEMSEHPNYDGFWQARNILPHLTGVDAAVLVVGGWFDTEDLYGPLKTYASVERLNPKTRNTIVMGPWSHGQWRRDDGERLGELEFGFKTSPGFRDDVERPWFEYHLRGGPDPGLPEALMFETGANRWRRFDEWPPAAATRRSLYLREDGGLSWKPPAELDARPDPCAGAADDTLCVPVRSAAGADAYISDPANPVPYTAEITLGWSREYMTEDQRFASRRPDVLVYETEPLAEDLTIAGPIRASLFVSTSGTASDFVVKLIDVLPGELPDLDDDDSEAEAFAGGRETLVRAEAFRGRFRESYERPVPFVPGEVAEVSFELLDVLHTFKRGHRVMVHVQSSWFPFVDRNPQSWVPNIFEATAADFVPVTNRVHRTASYPSRLELGVMPDRP